MHDLWPLMAFVVAGGVCIVFVALGEPRLGVIAFLLAAVLGVFVLLRWIATAWVYECPACHKVLRVGMLGQATADNVAAQYKIRCPDCGQWHLVQRAQKRTS